MTSRAVRCARAAFVGGCLFLVHAAHAGPPPDTQKQLDAQAAMERGIQAFARGELQTALREYEIAEQLVPEANLPYRYAGEALAALGRNEEAIASFEKYLHIKANVSDAAAVQARIDTLRDKLEIAVDVTTEPPGADAFVDGAAQSAGRTPLALKLRSGDHTIRVRLKGFADATLPAHVEPGAPLELSYGLTPIEPPTLAPTVPQPTAARSTTYQPQHQTPKEEGRWYKNGWFWTAIAATAVAGAVIVLVAVPSRGPPETHGGTHSFP